MFDTPKPGSDVLFLADDRQISTGNLWGIRIIVVVIALNTFLTSRMGPYQSLGAIFAVLAIYYVALQYFATPTQ